MNTRIATIALALFLVVDVVLVALALRPPPVEPGTRGAGPTAVDAGGTASPPTGTDPGSPEPTATSSATGTSSTAAAADPAPLTRMLVSVDADLAWRAERGTCASGGAVLEVTTDGGASWSALEVPATVIARIQPLEDGRGFVLGADGDCSLAQWTTSDNGQTWSGPLGVEGGWSRSLEDPTVVVAPEEDAAQPCGTDREVIDLSRTTATQAEALCADGDVAVTTDGGSSWGPSGSAPGALALANRLDSDVLATFAVRTDDECSGLQVVRVVTGRPATVVACMPARAPEAGGRVSISVNGESGWILVDDEVWTSGGNLRNWRRS